MRRLLHHGLFWFGYLIFKLALNLPVENSFSPSKQSITTDLLVTILYSQGCLLLVIIPAVYLTFYLIDLHFSEQLKPIGLFFLILLIFIGATLLLNVVNYTLVLPVAYPNEVWKLTFRIPSLLYHFFNLLAVVGIATALKLGRKQLHSRIREQALLREKVETELKFLKAQINPHFLFNTLNNIYALARKQSAKTPDALLKLSKLMRFMIYDANSSTILLTDEIKLINDYIELESLRYNDRLTVTFDHTIDNPHQQIAPLLLIHFVENAFKHGAGESRFSILIYISISLKVNILEARITNSKENLYTDEESGKVGMENIRRQLQLLYPNHTLRIEETETAFTVNLRIVI